ncbi:hypothetical protein FOBRF1_002447 [Fusarium oxysporum]
MFSGGCGNGGPLSTVFNKTTMSTAWLDPSPVLKNFDPYRRYCIREKHPETLILTICPLWFELELDYELRLRRETTWALMEHTFSAHHDTLFSLASTAKNNIQP